jgi:hypothetical protein
MTEVHDITPLHNPVSLARQMVKDAEDEGSIAGFYILLNTDDSLTYQGAGVTSKDLLWALERMKGLVLNGDYND